MTKKISLNVFLCAIKDIFSEVFICLNIVSRFLVLCSPTICTTANCLNSSLCPKCSVHMRKSHLLDQKNNVFIVRNLFFRHINYTVIYVLNLLAIVFNIGKPDVILSTTI